MSSFLDDNLVLANDVAVAAAAVNSSAVKVGPSGPFSLRATVRVNLSTGFSTGNMSSIALQTCAASDFASNVKTLLTVTLNDTVQTKPKKLVEFELPEECLDYVRLVFTPTGTGAGAKVFAAIVTNKDLRL